MKAFTNESSGGSSCSASFSNCHRDVLKIFWVLSLMVITQGEVLMGGNTSEICLCQVKI